MLAACAVAAWPRALAVAASPTTPAIGDAAPRRLRAAPATVAAAGQTALQAWAYEASVPGPELRLRQRQTLDLAFENALPDPSTVHWHGVRVPNAMDGVPHVTQPPVAPGEEFRYRFALPDAGTYWYHPHWGTPEQVDRGLAGALVIEEDDPPPVDADVTWVIDDWRLDDAGRIAEDFYNDGDAAHAGRLGRVVTINGQLPADIVLLAGQRMRLRLVNAANARIFALQPDRSAALQSWVVALDGAPLAAPHAWREPLLLGPGMRADLMIDALAAGRVEIVDRFGRDPRPLTKVRVRGRDGVAKRPLPPPLPPAHRAEPVLEGAREETIVLGGGMMSREGWPRESWAERAARRQRQVQGSRETSPAWTLNGRAHAQHSALHAGAFSVQRGQTVRLRWDNRTAWWHPMHLHGHHFRVLTRDGQPVPGRPWHDTLLLAPREQAEIAFVADNPGRWLIHCHVLEHHAAGMGTLFDVVA